MNILLNRLKGPKYWNEEIIERTGNSWAISCDFPNDDLLNIPLIPQLCSSECRKTLGCTHYYWAKDICCLKKNTKTTKANAINNNNHETLCGILASGNLLKYIFISLFAFNI